MGLYDTVNYSGDKLNCAKGHNFSGLELQTKNLGSTMSVWSLTDSNLKLVSKGAWWPKDDELTSFPQEEPWVFCFYGSCPHCRESVVFYAKLCGSSVLEFIRDDTPHAILFC